MLGVDMEKGQQGGRKCLTVTVYIKMRTRAGVLTRRIKAQAIGCLSSSAVC
jgi:hypothetical protein